MTRTVLGMEDKQEASLSSPPAEGSAPGRGRTHYYQTAGVPHEVGEEEQEDLPPTIPSRKNSRSPLCDRMTDHFPRLTEARARLELREEATQQVTIIPPSFLQPNFIMISGSYTSFKRIMISHSLSRNLLVKCLNYSPTNIDP